MRQSLRYLAFVLMAWGIFHGSVFASFTAPTVTQWRPVTWASTTWWDSQPLACEAWRAANGFASVTVSGNWCYGGGFNVNLTAQTSNSCPANSTGTTTCTCSAGFEESGSSCVPITNLCAADAGALKTLNFTVGWSRSSSLTSIHAVGELTAPPATSCSGGCTFERTDSAGDMFVSQVASAQGLHRLSFDWTYKQTATQCSTETAGTNPNAPIAQCPGYVGQVNGKTVCVGNASAPLPSPSGDTSLTSGKSGKPGNPAAGVQSGGSGTTPATGSGGNAGGPTEAATGGGTVVSAGSKPDVAGEEQAACGAPGQPKCGIDETGTPTGTGVYTNAGGTLDAENQKLMDALGNITSTNGKETSWGITPGWLTPGACSPVTVMTLPDMLGGTPIVFDICPILPQIHLLMNFLWSVWTFFIVTAMVFRVTTGASA